MSFTITNIIIENLTKLKNLRILPIFNEFKQKIIQ